MDKIIINRKSGVTDSKGKEMYSVSKEDGTIYLCRRYFSDFISSQSYAQKLAKNHNIEIIELRGFI